MTDTPIEREAESTWTRLRRCKVVQWGVVYVAASWGFLQGLEYLSGTYDWPRQIQQYTTLVLLIGLPIVLTLAWYHGDRGEQRIRGTELAIISLLFLAGGGIFWLYDRVRQDDAERITAQDAAPATSREVAVLHLMRSPSLSCPSSTCRRPRIKSTCLTALPRSCSTCRRRFPI